MRKMMRYCTCNNVDSSGIYVGFEVFTVVVTKSIIFWDITPCSPLSFNRRFGGIYHLHLQGRINRFRKAASKHVASCHLLACWFFLNLFLRP
jgi:hypothetical protein